MIKYYVGHRFVIDLCRVPMLRGYRGSTGVKMLCYKSEGGWFNSRWCHWNFSLNNPSDRTMVLGSTQPLTEMSTRNISWRYKAAGA